MNENEYPFHFDFTYLNFYNSISKDVLDKLMPRPYKCNYYIFLNTSIVKIDDDNYLYAVRIICQDGKSFKNDQKYIKPGNSEECVPKRQDIGINFPWNRWHLPQLESTDSTIFVYGNHKNNNLEILPLREGLYNNDKYGYEKSDIRIMKMDGTIYMHTSNLDSMYMFDIVNEQNKKFIKMKKIRTYPDNEDKNIPILSVRLEKTKVITFIKWYYKYYDDFEENDKKEKGGVLLWGYEGFRPIMHWIRFDNYVIDGLGSHLSGLEDDKQIFATNYGITPMFSFGTPHIKLHNEKYGDFLLGVGHIKIHNDTEKYKYIDGSNIDTFRKNLHKDMRDKYGDRYIEHYGTGPYPDECTGYIYMMYFYIMYDKQGEFYNSMKLSDSFLPILLDERKKLFDDDNDYKFSLIFPMGITSIDTNKIIVTCGYGDFYSVALEFDTKNVINKCTYDVRNLDMREYSYWILAKYNDRSYLSRSFKKITTIIQ